VKSGLYARQALRLTVLFATLIGSAVLFSMLAGRKAAAPPVLARPVASEQTQVGDLFFVVNEVKPYTDDLFLPEDGTHYVAVDLTVQNTGTELARLEVSDFVLNDSTGNLHTVAMTLGPKPKITDYPMVPGEKLRGYLVFPVSDGRYPVELQYQVSIGNGAGTILLPSPRVAGAFSKGQAAN